VSTLVCFHAHPDDEAIATGGTMALAAAAGHLNWLVFHDFDSRRSQPGYPDPMPDPQPVPPQDPIPPPPGEITPPVRA